MKKTDSWKALLVQEKKLHDIMELYPGKMREEVRELVFRALGRRLFPGLSVTVLLITAAVFLGNGETKEKGIVRPAPGTAAASVQIQVELEEEWKSVALEIAPLEYEYTQIETLHTEAEEYLKAVVPGDNQGFNRITETLFFPEKLPSTGGKIYWTTDAPWLISPEGEVMNESLAEPVKVQITAEVIYGSESRYFTQVVTVYPKVYSGEEALLREVQQELASQEQRSRTQERFLLPETVLGYQIEQEESTGVSKSAFLVLLAITVPLFIYSDYFGNLDTRRKKRKELAERGYTEFVTKLSLMLAAGITARQAFGRLAEEYEKSKGPEHVLSEELKVTKQELDNGASERIVYEEFGRRIGVIAYRRMASLLTRNVSRGVQDMRNLLLQEAKEVMAQERAAIRQKGEQAGTKLLLPMTGLLLLVFAILLVPALQSF